MLLYEIHHELLSDGYAVDADALTEVHQVGRGVEAYLVACLLQHGSHGV